LTNFKPRNDYIVVKRSQENGVSAGGIIIPDCAKEKPTTGEVLSVGPGSWSDKNERVPVSVEVGDIVIFPKLAGFEINLPDAGECRLLREDEILGKRISS